MRPFFLAALFLLQASGLSAAPTVVENFTAGLSQIGLPSDPPSYFETRGGVNFSVDESSVQYSLDFEKTPGGSSSSVSLEFSYTHEVKLPELTRTVGIGAVSAFNMTLASGSDWYLTQPGDHLSLETIQNDTFPTLAFVNSGLNFFTQPLFSNDLSGIPVSDVLSIPPYDFYLGFATDDNTFLERDIFGWVKMRFSFDGEFPSVELVESAVAYDAQGIVVGTSQAIPEPAGVALLLPCLLLSARQRSRPR